MRICLQSLTVTLVVQDLRCKVFGSSAEGVGCIRIFHIQLAQTEVTQGDVSCVVEKDVLGLEITVDDIKLVKMLESEQKLGTVESSTTLIETLFTLQMME